MPEEIANPEGGAMTEESVVAMLLGPSDEDKPEPETEPAQEPEEEGEQPEAEAEAEAEDEPAEDAEPDEEQDEEPLHPVKVDGQELKVTLSELINGYQRDADYRRKTQAIAEERRTIAEEKQRQEQITAQLIEAYQKAGAGNDQEPDWAKLAKELDPWDYQQKRADWESDQHKRALARHQAEELQRERALGYAQEQVKLLKEKEPKWATKEAFESALNDMTATAQNAYGLAPQEVRGVLDHRLLLILRDAVQFQKLQASKPSVEKKIVKAQRVVKPGSPQSKAERSRADQDALKRRARQTGSVEDWAEYLIRGA